MAKSNVYTRTGDGGKTSLVGGKKVSKTDERLEAYGTVDELSAHIGWLIQLMKPSVETDFLQYIQHKLFTIGSYLATDIADTRLADASKLEDEHIDRIERQIDELDAQLPSLCNFVVPGGSVSSAAAHICRTVCRRAERRICAVAEGAPIDPGVIRFINRLSDYLFVLARFNALQDGGQEIFWDKDCK